MYKIYGTKSGNQKLKGSQEIIYGRRESRMSEWSLVWAAGQGSGSKCKTRKGGRSRHLRTGWVRGGLHVKEPINQSINDK